MKIDECIIEVVAKAIFQLRLDEGEERVWRLPEEPAWDRDPRELSEWERDEYRAMARCAIEAFLAYVPPPALGAVGMALILEPARKIAETLRGDLGIPVKDSLDDILSALRKEKSIPSDEEIVLLVSGDNNGAVPENLARKYPYLSAALDELSL